MAELFGYEVWGAEFYWAELLGWTHPLPVDGCDDCGKVKRLIGRLCARCWNESDAFGGELG
jgi:hypothetical protein